VYEIGVYRSPDEKLLEPLSQRFTPVGLLIFKVNHSLYAFALMARAFPFNRELACRRLLFFSSSALKKSSKRKGLKSNFIFSTAPRNAILNYPAYDSSRKGRYHK